MHQEYPIISLLNRGNSQQLCFLHILFQPRAKPIQFDKPERGGEGGGGMGMNICNCKYLKTPANANGTTTSPCKAIIQRIGLLNMT